MIKFANLFFLTNLVKNILEILGPLPLADDLGRVLPTRLADVYAFGKLSVGLTLEHLSHIKIEYVRGTVLLVELFSIVCCVAIVLLFALLWTAKKIFVFFTK